MSDGWKLQIGEGQIRSVSGAQLIELFDTDKIRPVTRVQREADGKWMSAERAVEILRRHSPPPLPRTVPPPLNPAARQGTARAKKPSLQPIWILTFLLLLTAFVGTLSVFLMKEGDSIEPVLATDRREDVKSITFPDAKPKRDGGDGIPGPSKGDVPQAATKDLVQQPVKSQQAEDAVSSAPMTPSTVTSAPASIPAIEVDLPKILPYGDGGDQGFQNPVDDVQLSRFVASVERERTAESGLERIRKFLQQHRLESKQAVKIGELKRRLEGHAKEGLVRLGTRWVPPEEQKAAENEARALIRQAWALSDVGASSNAEKLLDRASEIDPNSIEADLLLGMWKGIVWLSDTNPKDAEQRFETVLKRSPDHLTALNNAAVAEIRQRKYAEAIEHLERAAELAPKCQEVIQNLGRLVLLDSQNRIRLNGTDARRASEVYAKLVGEGKGNPFDPSVGYLLMRPYVPPTQRTEPSAETDEMVLIGFGTGFVVAPGLILTNRHVVMADFESGSPVDEIRINVEKFNAAPISMTGKVESISTTDDLALVRFSGLEASALPIRATKTPLAEEIAILGYPRPDATGADLKFVSGHVSAVSDERMMFDCVANQGNSGGPVLSKQGEVVAVYNAVLVAGNDVVTQYGMGVPAANARRFVESVVGPLSPPKAVSGEWPGIVGRVGGSVFKLDVYCRTSHPVLLQQLVKSTGIARWQEDPSCPRCSGRGAVPCPGRCVRGATQEFWTEDSVTTVLGRTVVIKQPNTRVSACSVCAGNGAIRCPDCRNGIDPLLQK